MKNNILITIFIIFIFTPLSLMALNINTNFLNTEKRNLPDFPKIEFSPLYPNKINSYFTDNFGLRYPLIRLASNIKMKLFKTYPRSIDAKVLKGTEGWLFYKMGNETEDYLGQVPLSQKKLENILRNNEKRLSYLQNKKLYILIPPDKTVIYNEFLPNSLPKKSGLSKIEQVLKTDLKIIYPKENIVKNKDKGLLYYKNDTHWTHLGAYFGYLELMHFIKKDFSYIKATPINKYLKEEFELKNPDLADITKAGQKNFEKSFTYVCKTKPANDLNVVVFHDSFIHSMKPFFNCTFKSVHYIDSHTIIKKELEQINPDIVIIEIVQRNLRTLEEEDK